MATVEGDQDFTVAASVAFGERLPRDRVTPDGDGDPLGRDQARTANPVPMWFGSGGSLGTAEVAPLEPVMLELVMGVSDSYGLANCGVADRASLC